jgi:hypothetical protein
VEVELVEPSMQEPQELQCCSQMLEGLRHQTEVLEALETQLQRLSPGCMEALEEAQVGAFQLRTQPLKVEAAGEVTL